MEDPEKRKERLKAMRLEAALADVSDSSGSSGMPVCLSDPFAETSAMMPRQEESYASPRFDYYTDPMAAFSSNKRNKADQQAKQHNIPSPSNHLGLPDQQFPPYLPGPMSSPHQINNNPRNFQGRGYYDRAAVHYVGPRTAHPQPMYQETSPDPLNGFRPPAANVPPFRRPQGSASPFPMHQANYPEPWNRFRGRGNYSLPPNPGYAPHGSPGINYRQGKAQQGRGFEQNRGRGQTFNSRGREACETQGAERLYDRSMEEDPWRNLEPVLWRSCSDAPASSSSKGPGFSDSWIPKSIVSNKPRVSEVSNKACNSQQSLAEYLAASLDEATNDEPSGV